MKFSSPDLWFSVKATERYPLVKIGEGRGDAGLEAGLEAGRISGRKQGGSAGSRYNPIANSSIVILQISHLGRINFVFTWGLTKTVGQHRGHKK
jgi:hypothetical protein